MYTIESKSVLKQALPLSQLVTGSPMFRFYSCESGYVLPGHKAELITGNVIKIPLGYRANIKSNLRKSKAQYIECKNHIIDHHKQVPLTILIENVSDQPIQIEKGEIIGILTLIDE
jgi:dUTPase